MVQDFRKQKSMNPKRPSKDTGVVRPRLPAVRIGLKDAPLRPASSTAMVFMVTSSGAPIAMHHMHGLVRFVCDEHLSAVCRTCHIYSHLCSSTLT